MRNNQLPSFDHLVKMAKNNPQQLAQLQEKLTTDIINHSHHKDQLLSLHSHLQHSLALCKNPYHRCVIAMNLMRNKLVNLSAALNNPAKYIDYKAKVIQLYGVEKENTL